MFNINICDLYVQFASRLNFYLGLAQSYKVIVIRDGLARRAEARTCDSGVGSENFRFWLVPGLAISPK